MKRRKFLSLIGAATAAPLVPSLGAASSGALYSRTAFSRAVMHARLRPHVSARGIAYRLKLSVPQAEAIVAEMASKGMIHPITRGGGVHVRAISAIVKPQTWGTGSAAHNAHSNAKTTKRAAAPRHQRPAAASPLMRHLHKLCRDQGLRIHPRAMSSQAVLA